jgi:hypothetical protein
MKVPARPAEIGRWWKEARKALATHLAPDLGYHEVDATPEKITFTLDNGGMVIVDRVGRV